MGSSTHSTIRKSLKASQDEAEQVVRVRPGPGEPVMAADSFVGRGAGAPSSFVGVGAGCAAATMVGSVGAATQAVTPVIDAERIKYRLTGGIGAPVELDKNESLPDAEPMEDDRPVVTLDVRPGPIGHGSFGKVYSLSPTATLGSIKIQFSKLVLKSGGIKTPKEQIKREAELFRRVNGGPVYLAFKGQFYYLLMPHIPGQTLRYWLRNRSVSIRRKLEIIDAVLKALAELHDQGIYHGDLNVSNVLVYRKANGEFKVGFVDFGFTWLEGESVTTFARASRYWHPDRRTNSKELASNAYYDFYSLVYSLAKRMRFFASHCDPEASSSIAEVRALIRAKQVTTELPADSRKLTEQKMSYAKKLIFGPEGDQLSNELCPEDFSSHDALLNWLREKDPAVFGSVNLEVLGEIPLCRIRKRYREALLEYCLSEEVVETEEGGLPRRLIIAMCIDAGEVNDNLALPDRFETAGDVLFEEVLSETRVAVLASEVNRPDDRLLLRVIILQAGKESLIDTLLLLNDSNLREVADSLAPADAERLWQAIQPTTLQDRVLVADTMRKYAAMPVCSEPHFVEHTGLRVDSYSDEFWSCLVKYCVNCAAVHYRGVAERAQQAILDVSSSEVFVSLANQYKVMHRTKVFDSEATTADWRSFAHQSCFSLMLAKAYKAYSDTRSGIASTSYRSYVRYAIEAHNLRSFCRLITIQTGWLGSLHKNSFATFVLEASKETPWMEATFMPLFSSNAELIQCYQKRLYLPLPDGRERRGGWLWKPASRVQRDKVLQAVKSFAPEGMVSAATPS